jgi:hypothetical protein
MFGFSLHLSSKTFLILRRLQRYIVTAHRYSRKVLLILKRLPIKLEFSQPIFEKFSNTKFQEISSSGFRVLTYGRTDMTKLIFAFRNAANASKSR